MEYSDAKSQHILFKIALTVCAIIMLLFSIPITASAKGNDVNKITKQQIITLISKYGFSVSEDDISDMPVNKFQNLEDLEHYLVNLKTVLLMKNHQIVNVKSDDISTVATADIAESNFAILSNPTNNGFSHYSWYRAALFWSNMDVYWTIEYYNDQWHFTIINGIVTYLSGIVVGCSWTQTGSYYNLRTTTHYNDTADCYASGYLVFGFEVQGFVVGLQYPEVWGITLIVY